MPSTTSNSHWLEYSVPPASSVYQKRMAWRPMALAGMVYAGAKRPRPTLSFTRSTGPRAWSTVGSLYLASVLMSTTSKSSVMGSTNRPERKSSGPGVMP